MFEAELQALTGTSKQVKLTHQELDAHWNNLVQRADALFGGKWRGAAARSYSEPWGECVTGFQDVLDSLGFLAESVADAAKAYDAQESASASNINNASVGPLNL